MKQRTDNKTGRWFGIVAEVCRLLLGAVFIFSGLIKSIDPWGTAIKIGEYFTAFGIEWLSCTSDVLAVGQCALELVIGLMLVGKVQLKLAALLSLLFMSFFTALTLVIAVWNPVDDCGCFGDALKISNWMTFAKNMVLLPMSIVVWFAARDGKLLAFTRREVVWTVLFLIASVGLNLFCWYNLPPIDTSLYKRGTNLRSDVLCTNCMERTVVLVYENVQSGEQREFELTDTTWYDTSIWRYVTTKTAYDNLSEEAQEFDFALRERSRDVAAEVVFDPGRNYLLLIRDKGDLSQGCATRLGEFLDEAGAERLAKTILVVGMDELGEIETQSVIAGHTLRTLSMDRKLMAKMLRADAGIVVIEDGIIREKHACRNIERVLENED